MTKYGRNRILNVLATIMVAGLVAPKALAMTDGLATLEKAQSSYNDGIRLRTSDPEAAQARFEESATLYAQLVNWNELRNGKLYYNLANAQLQSGSLGESIANYLRAQRLLPTNVQVQENLQHARGMVTQNFSGDTSTRLTGEVVSWWRILPMSTRTWIAISSWILFWMILVTRGFVRRGERAEQTHPSPAWTVGLAITGAASLGVGASVIVDDVIQSANPQGVVVSDQAIVRKGNGEGFQQAFTEPLTEGVEFTLVQERPGWLQIELADGKDGWIPSKDVELVDKMDS